LSALLNRALISTLLLACASPNGGAESRSAPARQTESSSATDLGTTASPAAPEPPVIPTVAGPATIPLPVAGFADAVLAVPVGASDKRPLVIATHGNFDRPEWQCQVWSQLFAGRAFVLCPRGIGRDDSPAPDDPRFTYKHNTDLEREVDAAIAALRVSPHAAFVADGPATWAGFSLGAIMGVAIAERRPQDFSTLLLVEGGVDRFRDETVRAFAKGGGKRVMFVCAQRGCKGVALPRAKALERAGVSATVVDAGNIGHAYSGPVADAIGKELPSFLANDSRFQPVFAGD
jgi:pimeloyl-ACP methyl ester carboxylesterase